MSGTKTRPTHAPTWEPEESAPEIPEQYERGPVRVAGDPNLFGPIRDTLLAHGDHYLHLADLADYVRTQERVAALYADPEAWARKAILNVAHSGWFSSDRTIAEYAAEIWKVRPCPVNEAGGVR